MVWFQVLRSDWDRGPALTAYDRHPQAFPKLLSKSGFSRSRLACDDDALWFSAHVSGCPTLAFRCGARSAFKQGYLRSMLSRRQLQGFVGRVLRRERQLALHLSKSIDHLARPSIP